MCWRSGYGMCEARSGPLEMQHGGCRSMRYGPDLRKANRGQIIGNAASCHELPLLLFAVASAVFHHAADPNAAALFCLDRSLELQAQLVFPRVARLIQNFFMAPPCTQWLGGANSMQQRRLLLRRPFHPWICTRKRWRTPVVCCCYGAQAWDLQDDSRALLGKKIQGLCAPIAQL